MTSLCRIGLLLAAALLAWSQSTVARADDAGDRIVAALDAALSKAKSLSFDYEIVNKEGGRDERALTMKVLRKGQKQLHEFTAPADMKGTKVLLLSPTEMYVYLPAFGKVRRIASHTKDQGFLGLCFSQDDLATTAYSREYSGSVIAETPAQVVLLLTPRPGQQPAYDKIELTVNKVGMVPAQLKYFNTAGANIKTQICSGYARFGDIYVPGELKMFDHVKGSWTRLTVKRLQVNPEVSDDAFSKRNLEKQ